MTAVQRVAKLSLPPNPSDKFALIINGDTEERHRGNVDRAVAALQAEGTYQISVLSPERPKGKISDYGRADQENLKKILSGLKSKLDDNDQLVVYVTGHGDIGGQGKACTVLEDGCFDWTELEKELKALNYGDRVVVLDNCFSGEGLAVFADPKTTVVTQGSPGEKVSCQTFSPYFWSDTVKDYNGDKKIGIQERYRFALEQGQTKSETQFFEPRPLSLSGGIEADYFPLTAEKPLKVSDEAELKKALSLVKPGQLALVMFGADWCKACQAYRPHFEELTKKYRGQFLMIDAEGTGDLPWVERGIAIYPRVHFLDHTGKVTLILDREDPLRGLLQDLKNKPGSIDSPFDAELIILPQKSNPRLDPGSLAHRIIYDYRNQPQKLFEITVAGLRTGDSRSVKTALYIFLTYGVVEKEMDRIFFMSSKISSSSRKKLIPDLIRLLDNSDREIQIEVLALLFEMGAEAKRARPLLVKSAQKETDPELKLMILYVIQEVGHANINYGPILRNRIKYKDPKVSTYARELLQEHRYKLSQWNGFNLRGTAGLSSRDSQLGPSLQIGGGYRFLRWNFLGNINFSETFEPRRRGERVQSDTNLGLSFQTNLHYLKYPGKVDPYLALPELGWTTVLDTKKNYFSLAPLGMGLEIHFGKYPDLNWLLEGQFRMDFDFQQRPALGADLVTGLGVGF